MECLREWFPKDRWGFQVPDDPKAGTAPDDTGAAEAASGNVEGSGGEAGESTEQRLAKLELMLAETQKKYEDEHRLRLSHLERVEQANQIIRQGPTPPTPDPLDQRIADLQEAQNAFAAQGRRDPATEFALEMAFQQKQERDRNRLWGEAMSRAQAEIAQHPAEYRERAMALFQTGRFASGADAVAAAKGEDVDRLRQELDTRNKTIKDREADLLRRQESAPGSPRGAGATGTSANRMKVSDYARRLDELSQSDPAAARQLIRDKESGKINVVADFAF